MLSNVGINATTATCSNDGPPKPVGKLKVLKHSRMKKVHQVVK
jgi:hypothetical protein